MKKSGKSFNRYKQELLEDPELKQEYCKLQERYNEEKQAANLYSIEDQTDQPFKS